MNRVGDVGLALAIFLMFATLGTTSFAASSAASARSPAARSPRSALLLLLGACGKSGQFPLQAWLPDAMEGPTPVSALIHAATMVTAGVYLIARSRADLRPRPRPRSTVVVLRRRAHAAHRLRSSAAPTTTSRRCWPTRRSARSATCSWPSGSARPATRWACHLLTHGFFKAGLFLGAGSVMHGMNDQVDMRRFGGLWKKHAGHLRHLRPGLPGDHRLPVPVRLLHQGPDHRGRVRPRRAGTGWVVRRRRPARRRADRLLHDPADDHDLLRPAALEPTDVAPARVAAGHDRADGRAGASARSAPGSLLVRPSRWRTGSTPVFGEPEEAEHVDRAADRRHRAVTVVDRARRRSPPGCSSAAARCR